MQLREPRERVSPRARLMWTVTAAVEGLVLVVATAVAGPVTDWLPLPWWAVGLGGVLIVLVDHDVFRVVPHEERSGAAVYDTRGIWPDASREPVQPNLRLAS